MSTNNNPYCRCCPLAALGRGQCAIVEQILGSDELIARLAVLGIRIGCFVRVIQPGCPCAIVAEDTRIVLRGDEASAIMLSPV